MRCPYCYSPLDSEDTTRDGEALWCADCSAHVEFVDAEEEEKKGEADTWRTAQGERPPGSFLSGAGDARPTCMWGLGK